jgi:hypothetical protein
MGEDGQEKLGERLEAVAQHGRSLAEGVADAELPGRFDVGDREDAPRTAAGELG